MIKRFILISTLVKQKPQSTALCGFAEIRDLVGVRGFDSPFSGLSRRAWLVGSASRKAACGQPSFTLFFRQRRSGGTASAFEQTKALTSDADRKQSSVRFPDRKPYKNAAEKLSPAPTVETTFTLTASQRSNRLLLQS